MSISKTVVTWAEVRLESTMCSAVRLRMGDMGTTWPRVSDPTAGGAEGPGAGEAGAEAGRGRGRPIGRGIGRSGACRAGSRRHRLALRRDHRHHGVDGDGGPGLDPDLLQDAGGGGGDLRVDLVRRDLEERLVTLHAVADV